MDIDSLDNPTLHWKNKEAHGSGNDRRIFLCDDDISSLVTVMQLNRLSSFVGKAMYRVKMAIIDNSSIGTRVLSKLTSPTALQGRLLQFPHTCMCHRLLCRTHI
ncbi:hypothetical protein J6590_097500 [Homalodisca vitripennis]|nr:hypothetical protein J6590_097500 [Homalodisca vitripennis]